MKQSHHQPNDGASPFIEKNMVTIYEITKLSLTCSQVSRAAKLPGWTTSPLCISAEFSARYFGVLLQSDAPECSSGMIRSCYSRARFRSCLQLKTLNWPNTFTKSVSPSLRDLQEGLFKIILLRGLRLRAPGKCSPPLPTPMATWPRRSIRLMTLRRATNRQGVHVCMFWMLNLLESLPLCRIIFSNECEAPKIPTISILTHIARILCKTCPSHHQIGSSSFVTSHGSLPRAHSPFYLWRTLMKFIDALNFYTRMVFIIMSVGFFFVLI